MTIADEIVTLDEEGYPTEEALLLIRTWPHGDYLNLMGFVRSIWHLASWGFEAEAMPHDDSPATATAHVIYRISTAGWSGNESIIRALEGNSFFWGTCWEQSRRGGHYVFRVPT